MHQLMEEVRDERTTWQAEAVFKLRVLVERLTPLAFGDPETVNDLANKVEVAAREVAYRSGARACVKRVTEGR